MRKIRISSTLGSVRLAAWLIGALILMMVLAVLVPQRDPLDTAMYSDFKAAYPVAAAVATFTGADRLFTGWPIAVVVLLLIGNVTACTYRRWTARRSPRPRLGASAVWIRPTPGRAAPAERVDEVGALLSSRSWAIHPSEDGFVATVGWWGFLGSMMLHASIVILAIGGILTMLTSFRGDMVLTEGESVYDARESYTKILQEPRLGQEFTGALIYQGAVVAKYVGDTIVSVDSKMRAVEPSGRTISQDVRVNHPLDAAGKSYLLIKSGYAVAMVLDVRGSTPRPLVLRLSDETREGWADTLEIPLQDGTRAIMKILAAPVPLAKGQSMPARRLLLTDPRIRVTLEASGKSTAHGVLAEGQTAQLGDDVRLTFEELRLWNKYLVRGEPGRWVTYIGFWMSVIGALARFVVPDRRLSVGYGKGPHDGEIGIAYSCRPWSTPASSGDEQLVRQVHEMISGLRAQESEEVAPDGRG